MTRNKNTNHEAHNDLDAYLLDRENKVAAREKAVAEKEAALLTAAPPAAVPPIALSETDLDLSTASEDVQQGRAPTASPSQRQAYGKWLRENHPGHTPLKTYRVTLKKRNSDDRTFTLQAVDETDARRQAYQQAGIPQRTEGFNAIVVRI
ncbi:hypothetical protein C5Y96_10765 [Blastopirellula marina]|uniref:Uncharacterized protein n=1 Tax=Blastopirellula marina TaxID=124 RepID=A0A2S8FMD3_9BACT|nr:MULTISPECIES: hypothetical protein [Pirellulaceae]PQO33325.1 hypothetical protein C5Y96_10765 [Blastopirellula marina]RCS52414.1 hypothetical protein DTL36_10775 [Bremerella cremea]